MILQNVVLNNEQNIQQELYYRVGMGDVLRWDDEVLNIPKGTGLSTDTYMNVFDVGAWKKYTHINEVFLRIRSKGCYKLSLFHGTSEDDIRELALIECERGKENSFDCRCFRISNFNELVQGMIFLKIYAIDDVQLCNVSFETDIESQRNIRIASVICTYKRKKQLERLIEEVERGSNLEDGSGWLEVKIVDNASELYDCYGKYIKVYHNPNTGGSGGFSRGMDEIIRNLDVFSATHVLLMDDDVILQIESLYRLYALLSFVKDEYQDEVIAGRMFRLDQPWIQYTASEIWNGGNIRHIGWNLDMLQRDNLWNVNQNAGGEYSGWWFACFPIEFVRENRPLPFFLHCDDVEYGLRHGGTPIILNGIQVWHETYEYRQSPVISYYDTRNTLFVNSRINDLGISSLILKTFNDCIKENELAIKYMKLLGLYDYFKGSTWLEKIKLERHHIDLKKVKINEGMVSKLQRRVQKKLEELKMVKISIIVPIYNAEKYIRTCLDSILKQTLKEIEIICVDDGSTDNSSIIMDDYAEKYPRVKVLHKKNSGYGNSMNQGLSLATGEYIGIVESDDYIMPNMYEELYKLTNNGSVEVVKANFWDCYDEKNGSITKVVNREREKMPDIDNPFTIREYPQLLWGHPSIWTGIYKREFLINNSISFKEAKGGGWVDNPFFFETLCRAKSIKWTKVPYYCYRKTNEDSSSVGYDLKIPFERMCDNLDTLSKCQHNDEEIMKFAYARALMYLVGATEEQHYNANKDYARPYMQKMLDKMNQDVIKDDFNVWDQKTFFQYRSPMHTLMPVVSKVLIYNWVPFDNQNRVGGGVTIYCKNLIESILHNRPDVQVYFISSGWAYDITKQECYIRKIDNVFGERCRTFEIVNSPVPAPQDMLFANPEVAFESAELKAVFSQFINQYGPFSNIHFNNIEGLSLDILSLKQDYPETNFVFSLHNYVPLCMTGFYFQRHKHCNCFPGRSEEECGNCINRKNLRNYKEEMINRGRVNVYDPMRYDEYGWSAQLGFDKLDEMKEPAAFKKFVELAIENINKYVDTVLAVSKKVEKIAIDNGIDATKIRTSYIGTKVANYQIGSSTAKVGKYLKIGYLGAGLGYEEKGYPFLIKALSELDKSYAEKVDVVLTTTTLDRDDYIKDKLKNYHSVEIIHGYKHNDLPYILKGVNLGIIPVLWEDNLPQVAIEMVALGVPLLASDAGGATELCQSDMFKFKSGNTKAFLDKLSYFVDNPEQVKIYWNYHKGLVTTQKHFEEMERVFNLPDKKEITISVDDYVKLVEENEFLYKHFLGEPRIETKIDYESLHSKDIEIENLRKERDYLNYVIDETRKSLTYKIGRIITWLPRKLRHKDNS